MQRLRRESDEQSKLARDAVAREQPPRPPVAPEATLRHGSSAALVFGEWLNPGALKNRGQATPTTTVETALWAAAGGDVATLPTMLHLDDTVRAKAESLLAQLPQTARAIYPSVEHLIAAFTTKAIPLGEAQLVWQHQHGPDDAVACVFIRNPDNRATPPSTAAVPPTSTDKVPPMAPPDHRTRATYISLRRGDDGWRLVVPASAVASIAKEVGGGK